MSDRDVLKDLRISENMPFFDPRVRGLFKDSADKIERLRAELEAVETEKEKYKILYEQSKSQSTSDRLQLEKIYNILGDDDFAPKTIKVLKDELEAVKADRDYLESLQKRHFEERNHYREHYLMAQQKLSEANAKIEEMRKGGLVVSEEIKKRMVDRFLAWRLPDAGISFEPEINKEYMATLGKPPMKHEPVGTNLLNEDQAREMVDYMLESVSEMPKITKWIWVIYCGDHYEVSPKPLSASEVIEWYPQDTGYIQKIMGRIEETKVEMEI